MVTGSAAKRGGSGRSFFETSSLNRPAREQRLQAIKAIGRVAYRHLRDAEIVGNITMGGEEKRMRILEEGGLLAEMLEPFRAWALPTEYSGIQIRFDGRKVFDIRWDRAGAFRAIHFEPGEWEDDLRGWPDPIPFD